MLYSSLWTLLSQPQEDEEEVAKQASQAGGIDLDAEVFSKLSPQDVKEVVESVAAEMLTGLQVRDSLKATTLVI